MEEWIARVVSGYCPIVASKPLAVNPQPYAPNLKQNMAVSILFPFVHPQTLNL